MAINPHLTDQLAAELRDFQHAHDCVVPETVPSLIARLLRHLPGVDEQLLGEIVLHTADAAAAIGTLMARRGIPAEAIGPNVTFVLAEAGTRLYRESRR